MNVLLDTQAFLWLVMGSANLSGKARALIENPSNNNLLSVASLWEMAIKVSLGKLILSAPFHDLVPEQLILNGIGLLNIGINHVALVATLPFHHHDPFDRLLIAQAITEKLPVVSIDSAFDAYGIERFW
ncbi:MAG TPA: type II toxin-antitoxin system VapC family toxin [Pyrinomonadaceae bacterium]|jgi:PIN domain nuclease of toxin-antitoxin system